MASVGAVHVDVVPSTREFVKDMAKDLLNGADKQGKDLGERIGKEAAKSLDKEMSEGLDKTLKDDKVKKSGEESGKKTGGAFAKGMRAEIEKALASLPDVEIDSDIGGVMDDIATVREALQSLSDKNVGVDISGNDALAEIGQIKALLASLRNQEITVEVQFDIDKALAELGVLEKQIADKAGGAFDRSLRQGLKSALSELPDIELDADISPAEHELGVLRKEIETFSKLANIDLNINAEAALADVESLAARLRAIAGDETIDLKVRLDANAALAGLESVVAKATGLKDEFSHVDDQVQETAREIGRFAHDARANIEAALSNLPSFDIDNTPARRALAEVRGELTAFKDLEIGVDLNAKDALAQIAVLIAQLEAVEHMDTTIDVKSNAKAVIDDLRKIQVAAGEAADGAAQQLDRALGHFGEKIKTELGNAIKSLPVIDVKANTNPALDSIADLRRRAESIQARFVVDGDTVKARAEIDALIARARELSLKSYDISVKADVAQAIAGLEAARVATLGIADAGNLATGSMSRFQLILGLIIAGLPLIAGALLGISAAIAALGIPIAAIAVGMDGIKRAAAGLSDEMFTLKASVAGAFENGLAPAIANIAKIFPVLTQGLVGTAIALSTVAQRVAQVVSSSAGISTLQAAFTGVNAVIVSMAPALATFTTNFLNLISIGTAGMSGFGVQLQQVAASFGAMVDRISSSGTAQAAVQALFSIISSLIDLIGPITELGAVLLAAIGPGLAAALSGVGAVISGVAQALDFLGSTFGAVGQGVQTVLATFLAVRLALLAFGVSATANAALARGLGTAMTALGVAGLEVQAAFRVGTLNGIAAGFTAIGTAVRGALLAFITNPVALIITGIVVALTALSSANASAAAAEQEHQAAVDNLSNALKASGGAIDANIVKLTASRLAELGANDSMDRLRLSHQAVAQTVAAGGPAYDQLIAHLDGVAAGSKTYINQGGQTIAASSGMATASAQLSEKLKAARQEFLDSQRDQAAYADALRATGFSMVSGVGFANQLQTALGVLGDKMSDTSAKVKALDDALRALSGGQLTLEEATKKLNDGLRGLGDGFSQAVAAAKAAKTGLLDASGGINTTTEAGSKLFDTVLKVRDGMLSQATAAFDAAGGLNNVGAASAAAEARVQGARDSFIKAAEAAGINATEAKGLADRYGLIPKLVSTLLRAENLPVVQADIQALKTQLDSVPKDTPIHVQVISQEAVKLLQDLGIQVTTLPDGSIDVLATDQTRDKVAGIVAAIQANKGVIPVDANGKPLIDQIPGLVGAVNGAGPGQLPVVTQDNTQPGVDNAKGNIGGQQGNLPLVAIPNVAPGISTAQSTVNGSRADLPLFAAPNVAPGIATAQSTVNSSHADLPILGVDNTAPVVASATSTVNGSQADLPIVGQSAVAPGIAAAQSTVNSSGADLPIHGANQVGPGVAAAQSTVNSSGADLPIHGANQVGPGVAAAQSTVSNSGADLPIHGANQVGPGVAAAQSTVNSSHADLPIVGVNKVGPGVAEAQRQASGATANIKIGGDNNVAPGLAQATGQVTGTSANIHIKGANEVAEGLNAAVDAVNKAVGTMHIKAEAADANRTLGDLLRAVNTAVGTIQIRADAKQFNDTMFELLKPRSMTITVNYVAGTAPPPPPAPRASGAYVARSGMEYFAQGGMKMAKAMSSRLAKIVPPNTMRVIGDRQRGDEAFIPINKSPRSQSILGLTAQQMGYALLPMADGGLLGDAKKKKKKKPGADATTAAADAAGGGDSLSVPEGDSKDAQGAASATTALGTAMQQATAFADKLGPALTAITTAQQDMVSSGVTPLAAAMTGVLAPAMTAYQNQVGTEAPAANTALQAAQALTQASTTATAANAVTNGAAITTATTGMAIGVQAQHAGVQAAQALTQASTTATAGNAAANNAAITATTTGMAVGVEAQHAGVRAGQVATQASTTATAVNAATNNAGITSTTTGMSVGVQAQHAGVRAGQAATQSSTIATAANAASNNSAMISTTAAMSSGVQTQHAGLRAGQVVTQGSTTTTAANMASNNANMQATTATMSTVNQGHLATLRGAQGVTSQATTAFADSWRDQLARTQPDSGNPIRWVINFPLKSLVDAWNNLDGQFALGKHVNPAGANFATGGIMPGYTPGRDVMTANVSGGEAIMRPEWTRAMGSDYINAANLAARRGGRAGVQEFLAGGLTGGSYALGGVVPAPGGNPVDDAFKKAFGEIADILKNFGTSPQVSRDHDIAQQAGDRVKKAAADKVAAALAAKAGGIGGVPVPPGPILAILQATAAQFGWGTGPNWDAILQLVGHESGFSNTAQNPTSTAYGLFQFLDGTWASTGIAKTSDPSLQALAGMRYIGQRYGTPVGAWAFWQAHKSYDRGGVAEGRGMMFKDVIDPERVLTPRQTVAFEQLVAALSAGRPQAHLDHTSVSAAETLRLAESMRDAVNTQKSGSFAAEGGAGAAGTVLGAGSGRDARNVEQRLDAMIGLLQQTSERPQTIHVEDRSGNPVETARATQLALRLSRR